MDDDLIAARRCYVCGQADDHPRCLWLLPPDQRAAWHHVDCGARLDPPCEDCTNRFAAAGGVSGDPLRAFLRGDT